MKDIFAAVISKIKLAFLNARKRFTHANKRFAPKFRRVWEGYGYYISLALLLTMFGTAAYLYRNGTPEAPATSQTSISENGSQAVMAYHTPLASPSPSPSPRADEGFTMPVAGEITGEYAPDELVWNETLSQWRVHNGIDISAAEGTAVVASASGVISDAYEDPFLGNVVEIAHSDGIVSRYCSLSTLELVRVGDDVKKGDVIGCVGMTALIESGEGAHLHFEMLKDGVNIAPAFSE